jgi:hypothetical protein
MTSPYLNRPLFPLAVALPRTGAPDATPAMLPGP